MRRSSAEWRTGATLAGLLALFLLSSACGGGEHGSRTDEPVGRPAVPTPSPVTPARYVTDVTFVGFGGGSPAAVLRFRHDVSSSRLARRYRIWVLGEHGWAMALSVRDSLPVPRAGWRILPGHGLRVVAAGGGELGGLVLRDSSAAFSLRPGRVLDEWTSPTGQRSRLLLAAWETGSDPQGARPAGSEPVTGLMFQRREARPLDMPPPRTLEESVLLTDDRGDGLLVLRDAGDENPDRAATTAYTWIGGKGSRWSRVEATRDSAGTGPPGWTIRVPDAGIEASLRAGPVAADDPVVADSTTTDAGARVYALRGTLRLGGPARPARGVAIRARGP